MLYVCKQVDVREFVKWILLCVEVNSFVCEQIARSSGKVSSVFHFHGCKMRESKREI